MPSVLKSARSAAETGSVDMFDLLAASFVGGRGPGKNATPAEQLAAGLATLIFPAVLFCVVLFAGLWRHPAVALMLGAGFTVASFVIARLLSQRLRFVITTTLGGALFNVIAGGAALLFAGIADFYRTF
jgi:hypothetical protein